MTPSSSWDPRADAGEATEAEYAAFILGPVTLYPEAGSRLRGLRV
jgi:hypothetical protein